MHFIKSCNFRCTYCYATFGDLMGVRPVLPDVDLFRLTRLLARRFQKVAFAGGEPTLYRRLPELLSAARQEGALTNVVTNGSRIDSAWLERNGGDLDLLTLSIDSDDPGTQSTMGRATPSGATLPIERHRTLAEAAQAIGIGVKVNTVVTTLNAGEDMSGLIRDLAPQRWKILQAAPVEGQNDRWIQDVTPALGEFEAYVERHVTALSGVPVRIVAEPIGVIRGSYVMVDPEGRFFDSVTGAHRYSRPILEVGLEAAAAEVTFDPAKFLARGGDADFATRIGG